MSQCSATVAATGSSSGRCRALSETLNHMLDAPRTISFSGSSHALEGLEVGVASTTAGQVGRPLGSGRLGDVAPSTAAGAAADGDPRAEDTAGVTHLELGPRTRLLGVAVDEVDIGKLVEVAARAGDEEPSGDARPPLADCEGRLVGAVLVDPLGQIGPTAPAVVQLELVDPVDREELMAGGAAQPPGEGGDRYADRRVAGRRRSSGRTARLRSDVIPAAGRARWTWARRRGSEMSIPPPPQASSPRTTTLMPGRSTTAPTPAAVMSWLGRALPMRVGWRCVRAHSSPPPSAGAVASKSQRGADDQLGSSRRSCSRTSGSTSRRLIGALQRSHGRSSGRRSSPAAACSVGLVAELSDGQGGALVQPAIQLLLGPFGDFGANGSRVGDELGPAGAAAREGAPHGGASSGAICAPRLGRALSLWCRTAPTSTPANPRSSARLLNGVVVNPSTRRPKVACS